MQPRVLNLAIDVKFQIRVVFSSPHGPFGVSFSRLDFWAVMCNKLLLGLHVVTYYQSI